MSDERCKICGRPRQCLRYGAKCCNACAAFFVRMNRDNIESKCDNFYLCLTTPSLEGIQCQKCRFLKCLEVGIHCPQLFKTTPITAENCGEYYIFSKTVNKLFNLLTEYPENLFDFVKSGISTLLDKIINSFSEKTKNENENAVLPDYILTWAIVLQSNEIPLDELHLLFYSIIYDVQLNWLPPFQQTHIQELQKNARARNHLLHTNNKLFDKLTTFFANEFLKHYCPKMLK